MIVDAPKSPGPGNPPAKGMFAPVQEGIARKEWRRYLR